MIKQFIIIIFSILLFTFCSDPKIYTGEPQAQLPESSLNFDFYYTDSGTTVIYIPIQVIAGEDFSPTDISISYEISPAITAMESSTGSYVINGYVDSIPLNLTVDSLTWDKSYSLTFSILDDSEITPAGNYCSTSIIIKRQKFIHAFTGSYNCSEPVNQISYNVTFSYETDSSVLNNNFWDFPLDGQSVRYTFNQNDYTYSIEASDSSMIWYDEEGDAFTIEGQGTFSDDGAFTNTYRIYSDDSLIEEGTHYFTPN